MSVRRLPDCMSRFSDDGLRSNSSVVRARHPERGVSSHTVVPHEDVLQVIVERMT